MLEHITVIFSPELSNCPHYHQISRTQYRSPLTDSEKESLTGLLCEPADEAVIYVCSTIKEDVENVLHLNAQTDSVPVLRCFKP